jgi:hypothetical protein
MSYVFSSIKLMKRAEQVLLGNKGNRDGGGVGQGEDMPKHCIHI